MLNDLRYAIRALLRNPGFTTVAVLTLALGIGANSAIFSVVNAVLLRPLPFREPERIVRVFTTTADEKSSNHSAGDFLDLRRENQSFSALAGHRGIGFTVVARQGQPTLLAGSHVTSEFFDALGTVAAAGRQFSGSRDGTPGELKVVLSHDGARQLYGESEQAVGQRLRVNGEAHTVVGVMPPHTEWPDHMDLWVLSQREVPPAPVDLDQPADNRDVQYFDGIARLKPGVSIEQAQLDMNRVAAIIQARHRPTDARREIRLRSIREEIVGGIGQFGSISQALVVLQAAVGLVLLIAWRTCRAC